MESICYGTSSNGSLENGVSFPNSGPNFQSYSSLGWLLGRTYVHGKVRTAVLAAYKELETGAPGKVFVYGESGWESGGRIRPHKTHQNGLSVDLMVPVVLDGESVPLPTGLFNKYGYSLEFDSKGRSGEYRIDFEALGEHLYRLHRAAISTGIDISRVIFEVPLQEHLRKTKRGPYLWQHIAFSKRPAWVRHDEHFHVDFLVRCKESKS